MRGAHALVIPALVAACALPAPPAPPPAAAEPGFHAVTPEGVDLVFDPRVQTYAVAGRPGVYWLDGRFFRRADARWEASLRPDGPWQTCAPAELPRGLASDRAR
jgi:hypothetical protein